MRKVVLTICLLSSLVGLFVVGHSRAFSSLKPPLLSQSSAMEILEGRPGWQQFPLQFTSALATKLDTAEEATTFAEFCERSGLKSRISEIAQHPDPGFALGLLASLLTDFGNEVAQQGEYSRARKALDFAVQFAPRHLPAWATLALLGYFQEDCSEASRWARRVIEFRPDPNSEDVWEQALAESFDGEDLAALRSQMRLILQECH